MTGHQPDDDNGSIWDELEEQNSQSDLDREWQKRRDHFHTIGYRDGLTAGKEASAQEGFNEGFKESVLVGYRWGLVRGVTSALSCLSESLREKMVESQEDRNNFQSIYESVHSLSTTEALKSFYKSLVAKNPAKHSEGADGSADVAYPKDEYTDTLQNFSKEIKSLILKTPTIEVNFMVDDLYFFNETNETFSSNNNGNGSRKHSHYHTKYQTQQLEEFFSQCSHPGKAQMEQLGIDLGLEPKIIKYWFQNRRTNAKVQHEKAEAKTLKAEIENLKRERLELIEACERSKCPKYVGSSTGNKNPEHDILSNQTSIRRVQPVDSSSQGPSRIMPSWLDKATGLNRKESNQREMIETANSAMAELTKLLESRDTFWVKSPIDGRLVLDCDIYNKSFPRINRFDNFTCIESSKCSTVVALSATVLVEMFMDPNKWLDLFPTLVAKARMIEVLDTSMMGDDAGILQLMQAKLHILSPLVAPREIYFLRYSKEVKPSRWVIADVSCDQSSIGHGASSLISWKCPSGCLIQDKFNGSSEITWVEHVEVDSCYQVNLRMNVFSAGGAYGAERWLVTLQRMVERLQCYAGASYRLEHGGMEMSEMRKSLMDLSHQMVKKFMEILSMSTDDTLNLKLRKGAYLSARKEPGEASCVVLAVSSSVWLPVPCETLFDFLRDEKTRSQWDVLSTGNLEGEFVHISCGTHPGNRISIIRTSAPDMVLLQESCTHNLDSLIVYTPVRSSILLESALTGQNPENISLIPAGFIISGDEKGKNEEGSTSTGRANNDNRHGSILTVAIQVRTILPLDKLPVRTAAKTRTLTRSIVDKIKVALGCPR